MKINSIKTIKETPANFITAVNATGRIQLSGNTTWYVNGSTGSDTTGTGTSGAPWATIQKAVNTVQALYDGNGYVGTVQVADGSYAPFYISGAFVGFPFGLFNVVGDVTTPANCVISNSANGTSCVLLSHFAAINIGGFKLVNTGSATATAGAHSIGLFQGGFCGFAGKMEFGVAAGGSHIYAIDSGSTIVFGGATYTISGGAQAHAYAGPMARIVIAANGSTLSAITLSGTPAFSQGFIVANSGSFGGGSSGITFSGTGATGQRYQAINNGVIDTILSSTTFFPGSLAGTAGTGGLYI